MCICFPLCFLPWRQMAVVSCWVSQTDPLIFLIFLFSILRVIVGTFLQGWSRAYFIAWHMVIANMWVPNIAIINFAFVFSLLRKSLNFIFHFFSWILYFGYLNFQEKFLWHSYHSVLIINSVLGRTPDILLFTASCVLASFLRVSSLSLPLCPFPSPFTERGEGDRSRQRRGRMD